jgi:hypothetical protein
MYHTIDGPILLLTVYMPTEYNDDVSLEKCVDVCAHLQAIITDSCIPHIIIAGDLNCQPGCRFYDVLTHLINDNNLMETYLHLLSAFDDVFTYCSDNGANTSWIDHVLCSFTMNNKVSDMSVLHEYVTSDHRPLSFVLNCHCQFTWTDVPNNNTETFIAYDWAKSDSSVVNLYADLLADRLDQIEVPISLRSCCHVRCNDQQHCADIDQYYSDVIQCIKHSVDHTIPVKSTCDNQFNVPGWSDYVQEKYDISREAFLDWVYCSRPRFGAVFTRMSRSRAAFKLAFRYCKKHEDQLRADACAKSLDFRDSKGFWSKIKKINCDKATKYANCVGGVTGDKNVASLWRDHFNNLYNSVQENGSKETFFNRINSISASNTEFSAMSVQEISGAIRQQKKGKAVGLDGIAMEAYIFGNLRLSVHLCLLFNLFLMHSHIPSFFMDTVVVPLVKVKGGDLTDVNNYRAIALSNSISKILESVFLNRVSSTDVSDCYQFGFKPGHSTGFCTKTMKNVIDYYTGQGSHIFTCFVDFSKAFDRVNYWKLFNKLLDDNVDCNIVALLAVWYSKQSVCVRWKNTTSKPFNIGNGTRQGGLASPYFFTRYIRELISAVALSNVGCNLGGVFYNILAYADDIVLLAPSWKALQMLINVLNRYAQDIDMMCNIDKTVCMVFNPTCRRMIIETEFPPSVLMVLISNWLIVSNI